MFTSAKCGAKESDDQTKKNISLQLCLDKKTKELSLVMSKQLLPVGEKVGLDTKHSKRMKQPCRERL